MYSSDTSVSSQVVKTTIFEHFKPLNDSFSVVSLYIFEETCILLESPFHAELNGLCPNSIIRISVSYDCTIKYV